MAKKKFVHNWVSFDDSKPPKVQKPGAVFEAEEDAPWVQSMLATGSISEYKAPPKVVKPETLPLGN